VGCVYAGRRSGHGEIGDGEGLAAGSVDGGIMGDW